MEERQPLALDRARGGWSWLFNASKWHYFDEGGRALCGRWQTLSFGAPGDADQDDDDRDNCAACRKHVRKLRQRAQERLALVARQEGATTVDDQPTRPKDDGPRQVAETLRRRAEQFEREWPGATFALRDVRALLNAFDQRGAAVADALEALEALLRVGATGSEVRLLAVGTNGQAMTDPKNEIALAIHRRCDEIEVARARALKVLADLRAS